MHTLRAWSIAGLLLLTLGEARLLDRLLFVDVAQYSFVLVNVDGVLAGTPVWKSSQNRVLAPLAARGLGKLSGDPVSALALFTVLCLGACNFTLFAIARARGNGRAIAFGVVALFGLVRLLLLYKLEYPWDGIDALLFLVFGYAAARGLGLRHVWPLLIVGVLNHETILFVPLWYLLEPLQLPRASGSRGRTLSALVAFVLTGGAIVSVRRALYVGPLVLPGQTVERNTPLIDNPVHLLHNLQQWFWYDWREGRTFIAACLSLSILWLGSQLRSPQLRRASLWSLLVLTSVVAFGYVNETRLYYPLVSFWFAYRCPRLGFVDAGAA